MNITNIETPENIPENIWPEIFKKQKEIALKYKDIENMQNLLDTTQTNIDTPLGQKWIKDFAWRVTEEICEAMEAKKDWIDLEDSEYFTHYIEELIDALHFITELSIIAGYDENIVPYPIKTIDEFEVVYYLGLMCNCLKNKPWKQTQMLTDRPKFELLLSCAFSRLWGILQNAKLTDADIYTVYFKKNEINKFRIRSNY